MKSLVLANSIASALGIIPTNNPGELSHGQICLANDSLFSQATYQTELTTYGIGYADPNRNLLMALLEFLAPTRPGPRNAIITRHNVDEPFEVVDPKKVKREMLGDFAEIRQRTSTKETRKVPNRGLTLVLDNDQIEEKPNWERMHVEWLIDLLTRASLLEVITLFLSFGLTADVVWDELSNPDLDVTSTNVDVLAPATGFKANRVALGESASLLRRIAYENKNNPAGFAGSAALSDADIATRMGVAGVRTNVERYNNNGVKDLFLGRKVLLFSGQDKETGEDISNVVRHVSNANISGGRYATYIDRKLKKTHITVENYELFNAQHTTGCAILTAAAA
jgi:hypothetical protein